MNDNKLLPISTPPEIITVVESQDLQAADWNTLVQVGQDMSEIKTYSQWVLGKVADIVSLKYGGLKKYANEININYDSLCQYLYTYRKITKEDPLFDPRKYFGAVSWGILALAATKSTKPLALVDELQQKGVYTLKHAYKVINAGETKNGTPRKPKIDFKYNRRRKKYEMIVDENDKDFINWEDFIEQILQKATLSPDLRNTFEELLVGFKELNNKSKTEKSE